MSTAKLAGTPHVRALVTLVVVLPALLLELVLRMIGRDVEIRVEVNEA